MRKLFAAVAALAFVAAVAVPVFAADVTIRGELVDQGCYLKDNARKGDGHKDCATKCATKGLPVALVTADGKVYTVAGDLAANKNEKLVGHMSHIVELTGEVTTDKDGKMSIAAKSLKMVKTE